jgi:small nuclear ribonucleoprotein (snRNP)-like protein
MPQAQPELKKVSPPCQLKLPLPNLNKYLEKRVLVQLNGSRKVMGILRGYDVRF